MTVTVGSLTWSDTTDPASPIAVYVVNFSTDLTWQFGLQGSYHFQSVTPAGITIDNTLNDVAVTLAVGAYVVTIPAFQRIPLRLPRNSQLVTLTAPTGFQVGVEFWITADPAEIVSQFALQEAAVATKGWQLIQQIAVNAAASQLMALPATFQRFRLTSQGIALSAPASLFLQFSSDGGVTFITAAYQWVSLLNDSANAVTPASQLNDSAIPIFGATVFGPAVFAYDATSEIFPGSPTQFGTVRSSAYGIDGVSGQFEQSHTSGSIGREALVNFLGVAASGGAKFSGTLLLEGFPT